MLSSSGAQIEIKDEAFIISGYFMSTISNPPDRRPKSSLLILSCSARKKPVQEPIPAWDLYDGVAFRLLKRQERIGLLPKTLDILILSAQYGLIWPSEVISPYDESFSLTTARAQASQNRAFLKDILSHRPYSKIVIWAGKIYLLALEPIEAWLPAHVPLEVVSGGIGQKLARLQTWIEHLRQSLSVPELPYSHKPT